MEKVVALLLENNADPNLQMVRGCASMIRTFDVHQAASPLQVAFEHVAGEAIVRALLTAKADVSGSNLPFSSRPSLNVALKRDADSQVHCVARFRSLAICNRERVEF